MNARAGEVSRRARLGTLPLDLGARQLAASRALRRPLEVVQSTGVWVRVRSLAETDPDRVAVVTSSRKLTYGQLLHRVGQWQGALLELGCRPGDRVGVAGPRDPDTIAAFLAIEGIGAAYVPVDQEWPVARLTGTLRRTSPRCLIVTGATAPATVTQAAAEAAVPLLPGPDETAPVAPAPPPRAAADSEVRYLIYTSGSTGRPKGTQVTQAGMMNHLWSMVSVFRITSADTVAFSAPPTYVISIWQMVAVLLVGGSVAVIDEIDMRFGRRLATATVATAATVLELVPTVIGWLVDAVEQRPTAMPHLRCLISTGEKLEPALAQRVLAILPEVELWNAYGSTECSDDVSVHRVTPADLARQRLPAGRPIPNAVIHLLVSENGTWRPAEDGEPGELWVGGTCVGGGYLDEPELTAAAFVVDGIDPDSPSGRLYRTGDLAVLDQGHLFCLGRADRQIKIAGVRMELDEIEATLSRLPGIVKCAVIAEQGNGQPELAAYYVAAPDTSKNELYAALRSALPPAMVPRRWRRVDELPLNRSGKVDYRALPGVALSGDAG